MWKKKFMNVKCQLSLYINWYMICMEVQHRFSMTWWQISVIMGETDAALRSMWLKEGCCSDAEEREVHTACLRCVSVPGGHNWWTLSVYDLCVQPPTLRSIWFLSPLPCMQAEKGYREARKLPFPHVSQWAYAATALLPSPSTYFCSPFPCVLRYSVTWMSVTCLSPT